MNKGSLEKSLGALPPIWYVHVEYEGPEPLAGYYTSEVECAEAIENNPEWSRYGKASPAPLYNRTFKTWVEVSEYKYSLLDYEEMRK